MPAYDVINPATEEVVADGRARRRRPRRTPRSPAPRPPTRPGARWPRPTARGCCGASPTPSTATSRTWRALEVANAGPHDRQRPLGGRQRPRRARLLRRAPERLFGRQIPVAGGVDITFKEPLGVVGVIVPWNFPMPIAGWGFAPALAAGNTVVLKPAELTPLTAIRLGELALEAGLPEDVFQVLPGQGIGRRRAVRRPPGRAQGRVHRLHRGRASRSWPAAPSR